jgi:hypothetical protein
VVKEQRTSGCASDDPVSGSELKLPDMSTEPYELTITGQLLQPLNKGCIKHLAAVAPPKSVVDLVDLAIRRMALLVPQGAKGSRHQLTCQFPVF